MSWLFGSDEGCTQHHFDEDDYRYRETYDVKKRWVDYDEEGNKIGCVEDFRISAYPPDLYGDVTEKTVFLLRKEKVFECQHEGCDETKEEMDTVGYIFEDGLLEEIPESIDIE